MDKRIGEFRQTLLGSRASSYPGRAGLLTFATERACGEIGGLRFHALESAEQVGNFGTTPPTAKRSRRGGTNSRSCGGLSQLNVIRLSRPRKGTREAKLFEH